MDKNIFAFPDKDVYVAVPEYHKIGSKEFPIVVKEIDIDIEPDPPVRVVINFGTFYVDDANVHHRLTRVRPHFEMWIGYNEYEEFHNLAYYDPKRPDDRKWVHLGHKKFKNKHDTPDLGEMAGYGYAKADAWGDPNVGWV